MKTFVIRYVKYGNCANYNRSETIKAASPEAALKKFYNQKNPGDKRTRRQWMEYEQEANGIYYSEPTVVEIENR